MAINTCLLITLNVNDLSASVKRYQEAEWIIKQDPYICCPWETHFRLKARHRLKVK